MIYALGFSLIIKGRHVIAGTVFTPSGLSIILIGVYLIAKAIKHTWFTTRMLDASSIKGNPFAGNLAVPITLDCVLLLLGAAVLFLAARDTFGKLAAPAVALGLGITIGLGAWLTA